MVSIRTYSQDLGPLTALVTLPSRNPVCSYFNPTIKVSLTEVRGSQPTINFVSKLDQPYTEKELTIDKSTTQFNLALYDLMQKETVDLENSGYQYFNLPSYADASNESLVSAYVNFKEQKWVAILVKRLNRVPYQVLRRDYPTLESLPLNIQPPRSCHHGGHA